MKFILTFLMVLSPMVSFATGKISLQNNVYSEGSVVRPMVGFSVYEKLMKDTYVNMWTGYGVQPLETKEDVQWHVAKLQVDFRQFGRWTISPGVQYRNIISEEFRDTNGFLKVDYQLW